MQRNGRPTRVHYHLMLAVCSLLPLVVAMVMTSRIARIQRGTITASGALARQADRYDRLFLALEVLDHPEGHQQLDSETLSDVRQQLSAAYAVYRSRSTAARFDMENGVPESHRALAGNTLDRTDMLGTRISRNIGSLLTALGRGEYARVETIEQELEADRHEAVLLLFALRSDIRALHQQILALVNKDAENIRRTQHVLLFLIALTIGAVAWFGHRSQRAEMAQSEERQRLAELQSRNVALEQAIDGIATFDREGRLTWVNSRFAEILGYDAEELLGTDIRASLVDTNPDVVSEATQELRATGRTERVLSVMRKSGHVAHVHAVLVYPTTGVGYAFLKDVSKQYAADAALRLSEERFGMAMLATRDIMLDWDMAKNEVWMNEGLHTELGYPDEVLPNINTWIEHVHPDDRVDMLQRMNVAFADRTDTWTGEYRLQRNDGSYASMFDRSYIVRNSEGMPIRMVSALSDISARKHAEQELEKMSVQNRMILTAAADGIIGTDAEGMATFVNPAATEMLGWSLDDLAGRRLHDVIFKEDETAPQPLRCAVDQSAATGRLERGTASYLRRDGTSLEVEFSAQPMLDASGATVGVVLTFRDITERLAVERMKAEFVSVVSHELRTPLTSIRGALGLMAGGRAGVIPPKMARMVEIAVSNTDRLIRLINDILDIERIDSGKATLSRQLCQVRELIGNAVETMKPLADQADIRLVQSACNGVLFADHDRVLQTLTNLIGNAIKFSPAGTAVTVSAMEDGGDIRFCVSDQGRGIPKEKLSSIFERFHQVDASDSRQKGGSGLGLAICRSLVLQHGGEIHAESEGGTGSRFVFTLPRLQPALAASSPADQRTVVLCEDDELIRTIEIELLEQAGYRVLGFASGEPLLESDSVPSADVILLDMGLPGLSGASIAERLYERLDTRHIPVVIVSGSASRAVAANVTAWLTKPLEADEILAGVEEALKKAQSRTRVLLVESDADLARVMVESFARLGIEMRHAGTGRAAIELARRTSPRLIVLEPALAEIDGFGVIEHFKDHGLMADVPLIVFSTNDTSPSERDRLRLGPTEFLTKSRVTPEELERHVLQTLLALTAEDEELSDVA